MNAKAVVENGIVTTLCRMCDTRCAINVHIKDNTIVEISPFEGHPVNHGRICPRGDAAIDVFYHPDRILKPLKKQPDGSFREISRDQALDEIAEAMLRIKSEYGARSVGFWKGEGVGFYQLEEYVRRFARAFGSPNYFSNDSACYNGRHFGHSLVIGYYNAFPEFPDAGLILLFGTNPPMCHPPFMKELADAREKGAKLVVIDPRQNPVACYADIFAQPYPGTDGALGWGLIRYLIETRNYDHDLVEHHSIGFEKIARYAQKFTPDYVERQSGIYAHVVEDIAELIIKNHPRVSLYAGTGLEHHENGVNNIRTMAILGCLAGALDLSCGMFWSEEMDRRKLVLDNELPLPDPELKPIGADKFPVLHQMAHEGHSMMAMDYMLGRGEYPLKGMLITGANPAVTNPNTHKVEKALSNLDLLVVNDFFLTQTAKLAHFVFPAATFLERSDLHYYRKCQLVTLSKKVMTIPGIEGEYAMWRDLAHRLGFGKKYFPWENEEEVNRYIIEPSGITLEELAGHPEGMAYKPLRYKKYLSRPLPTPSGKVEFASDFLKQLGLPEIPEYVPPFYIRQKNETYPYILTTGARKSLFYHSRHQNIPRFRSVHPEPEVEVHPKNAADLGLKTGDKVRITSEIGSIEVRARIVENTEFLPNVVEMYHGWEECRINTVTFDERNDPISGFPLLKAVPVRLEKVD